MATRVKIAFNKRSFISAIVWVITYMGALLLLKHIEMTKPVAVTVALVPIITFCVFLVNYVRAIGLMDEVKQRIQLEAVVVGFALTLILQMVLFLLSMADVTNFDWFGYANMVLYCVLFYYIGYIRAARKYTA